MLTVRSPKIRDKNPIRTKFPPERKSWKFGVCVVDTRLESATNEFEAFYSERNWTIQRIVEEFRIGIDTKRNEAFWKLTPGHRAVERPLFDISVMHVVTAGVIRDRV